MPWKNVKGMLFRMTGPVVYQVLHAVYFSLRMSRALRRPQFSGDFFGRDLLEFTSRLSPGGRVLDIGAFLGGSTVLFARAVGKSGTVLAFEPVHYRFLKLILSLHRLPQVSLAPLALAAENGDTEFLIPVHDGVPLYSQSGRSESYPPGTMGPGHRFMKVPARLVRLDDFLSQRGISPESLDAVKIDVEGSELSLFAGGEDFFRRFRGVLLCEFWFNQVPPAGWTWLRERGYLCRYLAHSGQWRQADTPAEMQDICRGETYGNFFWEKPAGALTGPLPNQAY